MPKEEVSQPIMQNSSAPNINNIIPTQNLTTEQTDKPTKKIKPEYRYVGKESFGQFIKDSIPKQLTPSNRMGAILGVIFLAIIILALFQFPFNKLLSGDKSVVISVGYPWPFLELKILEPGETPLLIKNLFLDLLIYILLSYVIDVLINMLLSAISSRSKTEMIKRPKVYKKFKATIADKITKKALDKKLQA
jgi:hypothetical protein